MSPKGLIHNGRRSATSFKFGKFMFIYGGVGDHGNPLSELLCLDMKDEKWIDINLVSSEFLKLYS